MEELVEECLPHMGWPDEAQARQYLLKQLPLLERWKRETDG
jgi:hypothetical protein